METDAMTHRQRHEKAAARDELLNLHLKPFHVWHPAETGFELAMQFFTVDGKVQELRVRRGPGINADEIHAQVREALAR